jgi:hypothetical protein
MRKKAKGTSKKARPDDRTGKYFKLWAFGF